jgi:SAM-dependent methyltransferase
MIPTRYFMDDEREASRLARKVDANDWVAQYLAPWLPAAKDVLDVGCGPGVVALAAARSRPELHITGVDLSLARFADTLTRLPPNVTLQQADACHLPFADGTFDLIYSRFLLEYLPDKARAVSEMVRTCRPGGRVLLQDLDGQLLWHFPEDAELCAQLSLVLAGLGAEGFDPFVGRKLFALARAAGLLDLTVIAQPYHLIAGRADACTLELWDTKLDIALPTATKSLGSLDAARRLKQRFLDYLHREDTLTYSTVFTVVGRRSVDSLRLVVEISE